MWENTFQAIEESDFKKDIILPGKVAFNDLPILFQNAKIFIFPEIYAGFGIPILESFASKTPVIAARNSSLIEIGGNAAEFFQTSNEKDLAKKIKKILNSEELQKEMVQKGLTHLKNFSWEKCAKETLEIIQGEQ